MVGEKCKVGYDIGEMGQESGHIDHGQEFEFYSQDHGKSLEEFNSSYHIIWFMLRKKNVGKGRVEIGRETSWQYIAVGHVRDDFILN